jgi:gamma-glutamylcyclotransferase (GGCT)/AIG2-like uncharacterized protein YtfP
MTGEAAGGAAPSRLFAYGTLAPGRANAHLLADVHGTWEPATLRGHLVQAGWGAALGYPAVLLDNDPADAVSGMLLTSDALDGVWDELDAFEGDGYQRVIVDVTVADGTRRSAQAYVLRTDG